MLSLFETVTHSDCQAVVLNAYLTACSEQQAFVSKTSNVLHPVVSTINSKLNSSVTRYNGLLLLKTYLPQCSVDVLVDNVLSWMQQCLKSAESGGSKYENASTAYEILKILLEKTEHLPDMKRPICGTIVPKILEHFQQMSIQELPESALECLEILMFKYGPTCSQQKNVLEKCIYQFVNSKDKSRIRRVARCAAYLPLLGGGGSLGANHVERWKEEQEKLCATLHAVLDDLFDGIREIPSTYVCRTAQKLALPEVTESLPLLRVHNLVTRFVNLVEFLQTMLRSEFPVEKAVYPDAILGVVCRGLAVNSRLLGKKTSMDMLMIGAMLPQVHIALFSLLDSLISCCGTNLLPYGLNICKLTLQTLKWTSEEHWVYGLQKPFGKLREAACNTLQHWLQIANSSSCVELIASELVPLLFQDVWFEKEAVTLLFQKQSKGGKKRKRLQELDNERSLRTSTKHITDIKANKNVCKAALKLLRWIITSAGIFVKPSVHRVLQEKTIAMLFKIQRTTNPQDLPVPFYDADCRCELYSLLHILTLQPHSAWPAPIHFAVHLLSAGCSDPDLKVSDFCAIAMAAIEKVIHPSCGTLQFPISLEEMLESTKNYRQEFTVPEAGPTRMILEDETTQSNVTHKAIAVDAQIDESPKEVQIEEVVSLLQEESARPRAASLEVDFEESPQSATLQEKTTSRKAASKRVESKESPHHVPLHKETPQPVHLQRIKNPAMALQAAKTVPKKAECSAPESKSTKPEESDESSIVEIISDDEEDGKHRKVAHSGSKVMHYDQEEMAYLEEEEYDEIEEEVEEEEEDEYDEYDDDDDEKGSEEMEGEYASDDYSTSPNPDTNSFYNRSEQSVDPLSRTGYKRRPYQPPSNRDNARVSQETGVVDVAGSEEDNENRNLVTALAGQISESSKISESTVRKMDSNGIEDKTPIPVKRKQHNETPYHDIENDKEVAEHCEIALSESEEIEDESEIQRLNKSKSLKISRTKVQQAILALNEENEEAVAEMTSEEENVDEVIDHEPKKRRLHSPDSTELITDTVECSEITSDTKEDELPITTNGCEATEEEKQRLKLQEIEKNFDTMTPEELADLFVDKSP